MSGSRERLLWGFVQEQASSGRTATIIRIRCIFASNVYNSE